MTDNDTRQHGIYGVFRDEEPTDIATAAAIEFDAPASFDSTKGLSHTSPFGNLNWGNCFWAMVANCKIFQALTGLNDREQPVFVDGFTPPTNAEPVEWFKTYGDEQGTPFTKPPGAGTGIYSGAQSILEQGLARWVGVLGPTEKDAAGNWSYDPAIIRQAIYDFDGGAGFCLALDPKAMKEFDDHVPWGTDSTKPDAEMSHAVAGAAYDADGIVFWTWADPQMSTDQFDTSCIDGLVLIITDGLVAKIGEAAAVALAEKWGLTASPSAL